MRVTSERLGLGDGVIHPYFTPLRLSVLRGYTIERVSGAPLPRFH